jgi:hypothetical protein
MFLLEYCTFSEYCAHCARAAYFSGGPAVRKFGRTKFAAERWTERAEKGWNFFHFFSTLILLKGR